MLKKFVILSIILHINYCIAYNTTDKLKGITDLNKIDRKSRLNLVSFKAEGENLKLGLDFLMPFIKVPIVRKIDIYGNEPALININTAALVSTGILATGSALISFIFRKFVNFGREDLADKRRRSDQDFEQELWSVLNNFKLVYTNSSGARVDTSLSVLYATIDEAFQKNDINLSSCLQKAICTRIQTTARRVNEGNSSAIDKIIDGLMGIKWLRHFLRHTALKDAIDARNALPFASQRQQNNNIYCDIKYPQCKWSIPEDNLIDIIRTYLKFT